MQPERTEAVKIKEKDKLSENLARYKLEQIYRIHGRKMYQIAMSILHHHEDAEDAVQNCFLSLGTHMECLGEPADYRTTAYVCTVTKHAAIDIYRRKKLGTLSYEELIMEPEDSFDLEKTVSEKEEIRRIIRAITELNPIYREVLSLYYLNELSPREIAKLLHLPYNTVHSKLQRGKRILLQSLEKEE